MGWPGPVAERHFQAWLAWSDPDLWKDPVDPDGIIPVVTQEIIDQRRKAEVVARLNPARE